MTDPISRRDAIKVLGVAGAGSLLPGLTGDAPAVPGFRTPTAPVAVERLFSTSGVFVPPRGRSFVKFSFDFPEPSVPFAGFNFGFIVFTYENAYALDPDLMTAESSGDAMTLACRGFTWAGGQEKARGSLTATFHRDGAHVSWDVTAEMDQPIKTVTTVMRGVPRGQLSAAGNDLFDPRDNEILLGYPFSGGDLFGPGGAGGLTTPLIAIRKTDTEYFYLSSRDDRVRTKRIFLQPGETSYRVEAVHETEGWKKERRIVVPTWRAGTVASVQEAGAQHYAHIRQAYHIPDWNTRADVPDWLRRTALVLTLHGEHYTGFVFNTYAKMLEILRWTATQIPADRVLAFISAWDGRYYWNYPLYRASERMGGERGFRELVSEGQKLGFKMMPMFGMNAANRHQPIFQRLKDGASAKIDGDALDLNWVDWDNDRHQEGWLAYMNLGVESWRSWLGGRIADCIDRYGVDAYFLDIAGGWVNNPQADMHEGMRRMVADLRAKYPKVMCCGEMHYDAMLEFIPLYHAGGQRLVAGEITRHARFFQHLSHPAPGRGSTGVHEAGFGRFDPETLSLSSMAIPTLNIVDDTFTKNRDVMAAVIGKAKERAGL